MLYIGYHESTSGGFAAMAEEALSVNASTFAFFTRNPRGGKTKPIEKADAEKLCQMLEEHKFAPLVAHAPYTMNPCAADEGLREYAKNMMIEDLAKTDIIPGCLYNFHPGCHVGQGAETGIKLTSELLAEVFAALPELKTTVLIETMAGKGTEIGRTFAEVKQIIDLTEQKLCKKLDDKLGVCMDTCHIWDGGYDIVSNLDEVLKDFDKTIGLERLKAVHLNDSLNQCGAHKDRHAKIGEGNIGLDALVNVINHPLLQNLPFILETPNEHDGYKKEIELLRNAFKH